MGDRPYLIQLKTWFQVSDYRNFGKMKDGTLIINTLSIIICFTCRTFFKMARAIFQKMVSVVYRLFSKKIQILYILDLPILFRLCRLVVRTVSKELLICFELLTLAISKETRKSLKESIRLKS